ncbi:MAG: heparin lyase I family protein [Gemmatimonadaceae bacterium]|nr:heparin lyase I family protein [Gemmatimonadaceae bacterium]
MTPAELRDAAWVELTKTTDSYPKWKARGFPPATGWGKAKSFLDQIGAASPPSSGTLLSRLSDFDTSWNAQCVNRWKVSPIGSNPFTDESFVGTPWPGLSGPSILEVSTPHGPGFRFISTPEQLVESGGKLTQIHDHLWTKGNGFTDEFSFKFNLPAAGNPNGFARNFTAWNILWEHHNPGVEVPLSIGIDTTNSPYRNNLFFEIFNNYFIMPSELVYDHWYDLRYIVKWTTASNGFAKCWIDGLLLADYVGQTNADTSVNLQFGFYSAAEKRNEVWLADLRKA